MQTLFGHGSSIAEQRSPCREFKYSPLDPSSNEIRLLRFERSGSPDSDGLLRLEIKHFSLDGCCPEYHALSYVWGSPDKTWPVAINEGSMRVTQSLGTALRRFHADETVQWLWADALCINQADDEEKSAQVQKMRRIYHQARRVLSWLGLPGPGTEQLMGDIEREGMRLLDFGWNRHREVHDRGWGNTPHRTPTHPNLLMSSHPAQWQAFKSLDGLLKSNQALFAQVAAELSLSQGSDGPFRYDAMQDFLHLPNWRRVWILQEFVVAQDLYLVCGQTKLKYTYFLVIYYIYHLYYENQSHSTVITGQITEQSTKIASAIASLNPVFIRTLMRMRYQTSSELQSLLSSASRLGATDPRDRIFALLGLAEDSESLGIKADYTRAYADICADTAWKLLSKHGLGILDEARGLRASKYAENLPSWVPDWSMRTRSTLTGRRLPYFSEDVDFCASGDSVMRQSGASSRSSTVLEIGGRFVAQISAVGSVGDFTVPRVSGSNLRIAKTFLSELQELARHFSASTPYFGEDGWEQVVWQTSIAHRGREAIPLRERPAYEAKSTRMQEAYGMISRCGGDSVEEEDIWRFQNCHDYLTYLCRMADMKRPFACYGDAEYLGMGPKEMEPGDRIFVIFGANFPFVLRPLPSGRYKLIGEAYISGLMHGEVISTNVVPEMIELE